MTRKIWPIIPMKKAIGHFRNEKGTGAEIRPEIVSGNVTGDAPVGCWSVLEIVPELFAKVNSANDGDAQPRPQGFPYKKLPSHFFRENPGDGVGGCQVEC